MPVPFCEADYLFVTYVVNTRKCIQWRNPGSRPWTDKWKWPKAGWSRKRGREKGLLNLCSLQILLLSNTKALQSEIYTSQCRNHSLPAPERGWDCTPFLTFDLSGLCFLTWAEDSRGTSEHLGRLLSRDVKNLWILHQGSLGTHLGRNAKAESIASVMLSCCSLESSLQPGCEIRGLGTETRTNPNTKQGFCCITTFRHCLLRACGHHDRSLPCS